MTNSNNEIENQLVETANLSRFIEIFHLCFGIEVNKSYFDWKYLQNPAGNVIAFETINKNTKEIGAFYGIIPEEYMINGERKTIYQSMDTMTHPNYRNRGLFITLANLTYNYAVEQYKSLHLIGIPGSNSYHGFVKKLAWKNPHDFGYIFQHRLFLKTLNAFKKKSIHLEEINVFDDEVDTFFFNKKNYKSIYKIFNKNILNWKITNHPFLKFISYKIKKEEKTIGLIIMQKENNNLKIVYVDFLDIEYRKLLKEAICLVSEILTFKYIYTWEPTESNLKKEFNKCMFFKNPFNKGIFSYKVPLILLYKDKNNTINQWEDANNFELQPIIQD
jgi:hypothetical protein